MSLSKKYALAGLAGIMMMASPVVAQDMDSDTDIDITNLKAVRTYLDSKRDISIKQKGGKLAIGGHVRFEYKRIKQVLDGKKLTGAGYTNLSSVGVANASRIPANQYDIEACLSFEYKQDKSFANILLKFNNNMGLNPYGYETADFSSSQSLNVNNYKSNYKPSDDKIALQKAYFGYELYSDNGQSVELNLGRQRLYDIFDSRVMFGTRLDGVALKYAGAFEGVGNTTANWATYLIDDRTSHYGHAMQVGVADIVGTGAFAKYSINKSFKEHVHQASAHLQNLPKHMTSQLLLGYNLPKEMTCGHNTKLYAAYLTNHKAKKQARFDGKRHNHAWYAGFTMGGIRKPGDFAFDANWQYVEANAVSEGEALIGITRGNVARVPITLSANQGYTNYQGPRLQLAYQATADITLQVKWETSREAHNYSQDTAAGGTGLPSSRNKWQNLELEAMYSF